MLVSFSVSNFRSFGEEETLNLVASNKLTDHPGHRIPIGTTGKHVLRSAVIYARECRRQIESGPGDERGPERLIVSGDERPTIIEPFRFDRDRLAKPTSFEFRFLLGERVFVYGFDIIGRGIVGEWLALLKDDEELTIFGRDHKGVARIDERTKRFFADDPTLFKTLGVLAQLPLTGNQLFLEPPS